MDIVLIVLVELLMGFQRFFPIFLIMYPQTTHHPLPNEPLQNSCDGRIGGVDGK